VLETRVVPGFLAPQAFDTGDRPVSVAVGDFRHNGILDLAVANEALDPSTPSVSVLLGNGDGTFRPAVNYAVRYPGSVAVGDFRHNGILDLAVVFYGGVSILLGNGDGTFQAPVDYATAYGADTLAVGDFRHNGILDLAVTGNHTVNVLLGNGDGTFRPSVSYAVGGGAWSVAVGDFRHNGILDLVTDSDILMGNGDGTFQPARNYGGPGGSVAVGDFNGDGNLDLTVNDHNTVSVLLGNGDGTFQVSHNYAAGLYPNSVAVGDFRGIGILDLAVAYVGDTSKGLNGGVGMLLGNGDGSFQPVRTFNAGNAPFAVAVGDFDSDSVPDLAVTNFAGGNVSVLLGNGDGSFQAAPSYRAGDGANSVAMGDFRGIGISDLAVANIFGRSVSVLPGNGDGSFGAARDFYAADAPHAVAVGDFRHNGRLDLAVGNNFSAGGAGVSVLLGNGDGTFEAPRTRSFFSGGSFDNLAVGDFDGDGIPDVAFAPHAEAGAVGVLLGNGDGTFGAPHYFSVGGYLQSVAVGDFRGSGILDLAVADSDSGSISVLLGNGDGTFGAPRQFSVGGYPQSVAVGDFRGIGILDLAVVSYFYGTYGSVSVLLGNCDGTFQPARTFRVEYHPVAVAVGDFDGDGISDLAVGNFGSGTVSVLVSNGDGSFQPTRNFSVGAVAGSLAVADFNGDGWPDLAVVNGGLGGDSSLNRVSILLNDGVWGGGSSPRPRTHPGLPRITPGDPAEAVMVLVPSAATVSAPGAAVSIGDAGTTCVTVVAQPAPASSRIITTDDTSTTTEYKATAASFTANSGVSTRTPANSASAQVLDRVVADFTEDLFEEVAVMARTIPALWR
jgi:hypothetical protein